MNQLVIRGEDGRLHLPEGMGSGELTTIKGITPPIQRPPFAQTPALFCMAVFFDKAGTDVPTVCEEFLRKFEAKPDIQIFLHLRALARPHVADDEKYTVVQTSIADTYRVVVRHGYNDRVVSAGLGRVVYQEVRRFVAGSGGSGRSSGSDVGGGAAAAAAPMTSGAVTEADNVDAHEGTVGTAAAVSGAARLSSIEGPHGDVDLRISRRLNRLDSAFQRQVVYIVGKEQLRLLTQHNVVKRMVLGLFLWVRENTGTKVAGMRIPVEKLVEIGFVREI
ncbi:hypothetical protein LTS18_014766 [Coniosporium uncinatum]|uniref:Uncharacterized protein n=1 Tax=Coniosporium uncinatum TaxID=93489 RepID=A0ACC3CUP7_9PEZI|nr:hypothetical protein LTS18_014766 [Coniosporium uncinatum]